MDFFYCICFFLFLPWPYIVYSVKTLNSHLIKVNHEDVEWHMIMHALWISQSTDVAVTAEQSINLRPAETNSSWLQSDDTLSSVDTQ